MEEILASIRRIIAEEDPSKNTPNVSPLRENSTLSAIESAIAPPRSAMLSPRAAPPARPPVAESATQQADIDKMLAQLQATSTRPAVAPVDEPASDVLDPTEEVTAPEQASVPVAGFRTLEAQSNVLSAESEPAPTAPPRTAQEPRRQPAESGERGLVSAATTAAVDSAFNSLAQTAPVQDGRTLEDLVREMLRPMLKTWLDDNLPSMVDRLVRAEIERVSRGRG
jgi:uncharacterized protein